MATVSRQSYSAFGLTVSSDLALPELPRVEQSPPTDADVVVERGTVDRPTDADEETTFHYESATECKLLYPAADVLVAGGRRIVVDPAPETPHEVVRHLVVGPAFNYLLHQRGLLVLHASTVAVDGRAVAFVGESGQGKTTTATGFLHEGHTVLSDDVAAVTLTDDGPAVRSGYPSVKLDPSVVDRFDLAVEQPADPSPARNRHFYRTPHDQPSEPVPLERVYLLEEGPTVETASIPPGRQLMQLVENTYVAGLLGGDGEAESNFGQSATVAEAVEVKRLRRPRTYDALSGVVETVRADIGRQ